MVRRWFEQRPAIEPARGGLERIPCGMRAVVIQRQGMPVSGNVAFATDWPEPAGPGPGQVLIQVAFAGLRWGDIMGRKGIPVRGATPPFTPGPGFTKSQSAGPAVRHRPGAGAGGAPGRAARLRLALDGTEC